MHLDIKLYSLGKLPLFRNNEIMCLCVAFTSRVFVCFVRIIRYN